MLRESNALSVRSRIRQLSVEFGGPWWRFCLWQTRKRDRRLGRKSSITCTQARTHVPRAGLQKHRCRGGLLLSLDRRLHEVSSVGRISAKRGAEIYLWEKEKRTTSELELLQSTAT